MGFCHIGSTREKGSEAMSWQTVIVFICALGTIMFLGLLAVVSVSVTKTKTKENESQDGIWHSKETYTIDADDKKGQ
jgi:hypothetical protein